MFADRWCAGQLSLFSIVQFPNEESTGSTATSNYGTCYTRHGHMTSYI